MLPGFGVAIGLSILIALGIAWWLTTRVRITPKRVPLKVSAIEADTVYYTEGPADGTQVVTWGAVELSGIEFGMGK